MFFSAASPNLRTPQKVLRLLFGASPLNSFLLHRFPSPSTEPRLAFANKDLVIKTKSNRFPRGNSCISRGVCIFLGFNTSQKSSERSRRLPQLAAAAPSGLATGARRSQVSPNSIFSHSAVEVSLSVADKPAERGQKFHLVGLCSCCLSYGVKSAAARKRKLKKKTEKMRIRRCVKVAKA